MSVYVTKVEGKTKFVLLRLYVDVQRVEFQITDDNFTPDIVFIYFITYVLNWLEQPLYGIPACCSTSFQAPLFYARLQLERLKDKIVSTIWSFPSKHGGPLCQRLLMAA